MPTPSEDFMQSERRRTRTEMRTRFALALSAGVLAEWRRDPDPQTIASTIYDLAEALADEDRARCERDGR